MMPKGFTGLVLGFLISTSAFAGFTPGKVTVDAYPQNGHTHYDIWFAAEVDWDSIDVITDVLDKAKPNDVVQIEIDSGGGWTDSSYQYLKHMRTTNAEVITVCHECDSAASVMFMGGDVLVPLNNSIMVVHLMSNGPRIPENIVTYEYAKRHGKIKEYNAWLQAMIDVGIKDIMTQNEWNRMLQGQNIVIQGKDLQRRIAKLSKRYRGNISEKGESRRLK